MAVVGIGAAGPPQRPDGQRPDGRRPGPPAGHRGSRRIGIRPLWAAAAALVLVSAGVAGTYLAMSGSPSGQSAGPASSSLATATQSPAAALAKTASPVASHSPSARATTPSAQPKATAADTPTPASTGPVGAPGVAEPTGPNLVADGDFSDSTLGAWNLLQQNTVVVSAGARGGYAAQMTGPYAGVTELVTGLKPGTEYELTGYIISDTGNFSTYVGAKAYDSSAGVSRALNTTSWEQAVLTFTPAPGHTTAQVFCWQAVAGTGYCTDVSLRAMT
jgi:hypothetical protein